MEQVRNNVDAAAVVTNENGTAPFLLVCEHACNHVPAQYHDLGLTRDVLNSHAAWDPGALAVAEHLAVFLDAVLVSSRVSRLVYDCNRPPESPGAMRDTSEVFEIPGNRHLDAAAKGERVKTVYEPFRDLLAETIKSADMPPALVTIHSFTPVYNGVPRQVELGILHDSDARLADAVLENAAEFTRLDTRRNAPYGAADGVTHTLKLHAQENGLLNVMIEIRNDLIATEDDQRGVARMLAGLLTAALATARNTPRKEARCHA
jgi:predicted N-formylglutamate amidohydrolase